MDCSLQFNDDHGMLFGLLDGQDDRDEGPSYFVSHRTVIRCSTA